MNKKALAGIAIIAIVLGCGRFGNTDKIKIDASESDFGQKRIVCLAKQYNEIIYALGAEKELIAVDLSSTYPQQIKELPTVGYHRALSAEGILSMNPDLIIHDNNIGPEHVVRQLEQLKIPMKTFGKYERSIAGTQALMREMGEYFNQEARAEELCVQLENDMKVALLNATVAIDTPKVVVIHFGRASNVYLTVTENSTAGKMISWAGGKMAIDGERGMRHLTSPELIAKANPDVILLTDFGYDRLGNMQKIHQLPGVSGTNAAKTGRIYRVEEHDLIYIGPRTGKNVLMLQELIHRAGNETTK